MVDKINELIDEIKRTIPTTMNLASRINLVEQFATVQDSIAILSTLQCEIDIEPIIKSFRDYFQPILFSTISYQSDFIKVVEPILRTPKLVLHTTSIREARYHLSKAFSYQSVLNDLIEPTLLEEQIGEILYLHHSNATVTHGLKQTSAFKILMG